MTLEEIKMTKLHRAAKRGHVAVVKVMLKARADMEARDENGGTVLHWAAGQRHAEAVKVLLEHGANVGVRDKRGATPRNVAEHDEVARLLDQATREL